VEKGFFHLTYSPPRQVTIQQSVTRSFKSIDTKVKDYTQGTTDIGGLAFLALAGAGIYQISKGNFAAPAWYTAFWYALNVFLKTNKESGNGE
jgi:hypothetical protein